MCRGERELVEVVLDGLDLRVVPDLVAEAEERVLDDAADLGDRVQMADRQVLAGQRDVDNLVAEAAVELLVLEQLLALGDGGLEALADAIQEHAGLSVADAAERLGELALAAQVADARVIELHGAARSGDRGARFALVRLPVYGGEARRVSPGPVVELGVGTGRIAVPIAAEGIRVIGVDSSAGMLEVCRERAELAEVGELVDLRLGDMRRPPVGERVSLVICPFRSLLHLHTDRDRLEALAGVYARLVPGGRLIFDVFTPSAADIAETDGRWLEREPEIFERADWDSRKRTLTLSLRGPDGEAAMTLAWLSPAEWRELIARTGFRVEQCYGWFDRTPYAGAE